jgi:hypothetical protein
VPTGADQENQNILEESMKTFTVNELRPEANPHFVDGPLHPWLSSVHVRRTEKGTWAIALVGTMHPDAMMPAAKDRLYVDGNFPEDVAVRKASWIVRAKFAAREEGSYLVQAARKLLPRQEDKDLVQGVMDSLFGDWLYKNMFAQDAAAYGVDMYASGTWNCWDLIAYLKQEAINYRVRGY